MKEFMTFVWILVFGSTFVGCTTFQKNEDGVRRACRSGIESYDDGSVNFTCKSERINSHDEGRK